ncbi:MAG: c-type cytochrome biogenesis protein CcmI [Amaricoccus sp.]
MQADWLFWGIAALVAAGCAGLVFAPLVRAGAGPARRASYDLQVHRDQLREVEADLARGILSADEAAATRIEVSRRLLAAADAEAAEAAGGAAPRRLSRVAAPAMVAGLVAAAFGLYAWLGGAGAPDAPLAPRLAEAAAARAGRPSQAEAEAAVARQQDAPPPVAVSANDLELIGKLEDALKTRPDDLAGHRLLAQTLASIGNWAPARAAQDQVVALLGDKATARDLVDLAELSILAAGGYVSPEAEQALSRALVLDPHDQVGRYYSALTLMQGGRPDLAYRIWSGLLAEGPADAPWAEGARAGAAEAARQAGIAPDAAAAGPTQSDVDAAQALPPDQRQAMIEGMVAQLSDRLATQGGPPADWARLIRSLGVLGRRDEAAAILAEARQKHAGDPAGLAEIEAAGRDAGLGP